MTDTPFIKYSILVGKYLLHQDSLKETTPIKYLLDFIKKDILVTYATEKLEIKKLPKKTKKEEVVSLVAESATHPQLLEIFQDNAVFFALHPIQLEEILGCSKTERKRWTEEDRLPILHYEEFKYGKYPVYDFLRTIARLDQVSIWREEHENKKAQRRKQVAQTAKETRQKRAQERQEKLNYLQTAKQRWGEFSEVFELAYWAVIAHQLSDFYREKIRRAKSKGEEYSRIAEELDNLKASAIEVISKSKLTTLNFSFNCDYPPDVVWSQSGWMPYFEAEKGKHDLTGFYICELNLSTISERALFIISNGERERYDFPDCEDLVAKEMEEMQSDCIFWREETAITEGDLFTPKQVTQAINRCLNHQTIEEIRENGKEKFLELSHAAKLDRAEILEEQRQNAFLFREQFQQRLQSRKTTWLRHSPQNFTYFELAELTRWVSRAAKSLQQHDLSQLADKFYHLKNRAIGILNTCPLAKLTFYRPESPDYGYYDYYHDQFVAEIKDYYSLFSTEIIVPNSTDPDDCFQFHTPYPMGKNLFPSIGELEQVNHLEQEGRFRFGHPLTELELLIFNPQQIEDQILELIQQFDAKEIDQRRQQRFREIAEATRQKRQRIKELEAMEVFLVENDEEASIAYFYQITKELGLSKSKAISWIRKQLKSIATCSETLKNYPEFSAKYFNQACKRKWSHNTLKSKIKKIERS